jgi:hypothetical protein
MIRRPTSTICLDDRRLRQLRQMSQSSFVRPLDSGGTTPGRPSQMAKPTALSKSRSRHPFQIAKPTTTPTRETRRSRGGTKAVPLAGPRHSPRQTIKRDSDTGLIVTPNYQTGLRHRFDDTGLIVRGSDWCRQAPWARGQGHSTGARSGRGRPARRGIPRGPRRVGGRRRRS